ncbi:MAG TPA: 2Fe-2S iron-sulfur cluster binding domain-containing protein [Pseudonocardia sp.]|jgi:ferredoxin
MQVPPASSSRVVEVQGRGRIVCPPGVSVLRAMVAAGRADLPLGCRSGGCGVCRVRVEHGEYTVGPMSAAQVDAEAAAEGIALACRLFPSTDLRITAIGRRIPRATAGTAATRTESTTSNSRRNAS